MRHDAGLRGFPGKPIIGPGGPIPDKYKGKRSKLPAEIVAPLPEPKRYEEPPQSKPEWIDRYDAY